MFLSLLPDAQAGERRFYDGQGWSNAFDDNPLIASWSDGDGPATLDNLDYSLGNLGLFDELTQFVANGNFGIGLDPDCHYFNDGIEFKITTETRSVPDGGMTMMLLGSALIGLEGLRRKLLR